VILISKAGQELVDPPGRDLLMNSTHTFADLASAIDRGFARWDLSHLHEFRFADGRRVIMMEGADEFEEIDPARHLDEQVHSLSSLGLHMGARSSMSSTSATAGSTVALSLGPMSIQATAISEPGHERDGP
jgi:hypothetical protein